MVCPQCGKDTSEYASFCSHCGGPLRQGAQFQANTVESVQPAYEEKVPPPPEYIQNSYTPAQPPNAYMSGPPSNPYTPAQPPNAYMSGAPSNPYVSGQSSNAYMSGPPSNPYAPAQPPNAYISVPPLNPYTPTQPPKKGKGMLIIILSAVALLIIISSIIGVSAYKQQAAQHVAATNTALTGTAHTQATGTVVAQASATALAKANPYSPTMQTLVSTTLTGSQDITDWDNNTTCMYKQGYVISTTNGQLVSCNYNKNVGADYTAEMDVNINNDNAEGGMILRETADTIEILYIDKGLVALQVFDSVKTQNILLKNASAPIAVNVDALVAVVVNHGVMTVFVNHEQALTIDDNRADIGQTYPFALLATSINNKGASTATYKNVRLWTV